MKKKGLFGGIDLNSKNLVIMIAAAIAAFYITRKALKKTSIASPAKVYKDDIDKRQVVSRILHGIVAHSTEKDKVRLAMDQIVAVVDGQKPYIDNMILERKNGIIDRQEFNDKINQLVNMIANELGIQMKQKNERI